MPLDVPIIDSHVHLWEYGRLTQPWLEAVLPLQRFFSMPAYTRATAGLPIAGMVNVETAVARREAYAEAQWVAQLAQNAPSIIGVVAAAPPEQVDAAQMYLNQLQTLSSHICGVRYTFTTDSPPDHLSRPSIQATIHSLAMWGLTCDLWVPWTHLSTVATLVAQCPQVRFILNHLGNPPREAAGVRQWRRHVVDLATLPNVACKVSGSVGTVGDDAALLATLVEEVLSDFGPERVIFGGDWPVITLATSLHRWVSLLDDLTVTYPQRHLLWGGNALRWYHLDPVSVVSEGI